VRELAKEIFNEEFFCLTVMGPVEGKDFEKVLKRLDRWNG